LSNYRWTAHDEEGRNPRIYWVSGWVNCLCKAVDRGMRMEGIQLMEKLGGKSGHWKA